MKAVILSVDLLWKKLIYFVDDAREVCRCGAYLDGSLQLNLFILRPDRAFVRHRAYLVAADVRSSLDNGTFREAECLEEPWVKPKKKLVRSESGDTAVVPITTKAHVRRGPMSADRTRVWFDARKSIEGRELEKKPRLTWRGDECDWDEDYQPFM